MIVFFSAQISFFLPEKKCPVSEDVQIWAIWSTRLNSCVFHCTLWSIQYFITIYAMARGKPSEAYIRTNERRMYTGNAHFLATKQTISKAWKTLLLSFEEVKWQVHWWNEKLTVIFANTWDTFFCDLATLVGPGSSNEFAYPLFWPVEYLFSLPVMALEPLWGLAFFVVGPPLPFFISFFPSPYLALFFSPFLLFTTSSQHAEPVYCPLFLLLLE